MLKKKANEGDTIHAHQFVFGNAIFVLITVVLVVKDNLTFGYRLNPTGSILLFGRCSDQDTQ